MSQPLQAIRLAAALLAFGGLSFAVGPDYKRPEVTAPANWQDPSPWAQANPTDSIPKGKWWTLFKDDELSQYEERAAKENQTLKAAGARLAAARAAARIAGADLYPELDAGAQASRQRLSANRPTSTSILIPTTAITQNVFSIPFTLNYELDIFGRIRKNLEASNASYQASAADLENVKLMIGSELAADYFTLRELDAEMQVVQRAIDFERQGLELVQRRHAGGAVSGLDVAQQEAVLDTSITTLAQLQQQRAQYEHAIAELQGIPAPAFKALVRPLAGEPPPVPLALPSELLQRRPDIANAERNVAAENALIGVARAAFYPRISLSAQGGVNSRDIANLLDAPSAIWSIGLSALEPVIAGGRNRARLANARANYDASVASYRESSLVAFQQVEDALSGLNALNAASRSQQSAVEASERYLNLANARYTGGLVTYLDVITAQQTVLNNERLATQLLGQRLVTSVYLVKALGGGWDDSSLAAIGVKPSLKQALQQ